MPSPHNEAVSNVLRLTQLWLNGWRHKRVAPSPSTRWLMEQAATRLNVSPPATDDEEFDWVSRTFSQASAMTLYVAARGLADRGQRDDALAVLGDACRAQGQVSGTQMRATRLGEAPVIRTTPETPESRSKVG
jgi:hypothetical protein